MAWLLNIAINNTVRFPRRIYYFEYKGIRFKLVQNDPKEHHDHLLTIIPFNDVAERDKAFSVAAEFVSAMAWSRNARMTVADSGGSGYPTSRRLRQAFPTVYGWPQFPSQEGHLGGELIAMARVRTSEERIALSLFREARASNNRYLAFMFFWQVLEVMGKKPARIANRLFRDHEGEVRVRAGQIQLLPLNGRSLGKYLEDDCRHAIAHVRRYKGRKPLNLDDWNDLQRFAISVRVVEALATLYIQDDIGLGDELVLVRPPSGGFPRFVERGVGRGYRLAYPPRSTAIRTRRFRIPPRRARHYI